MSEPASPDRRLEGARRHLERRGYLHASLPPGPPSPLRLMLVPGAFALALTALLAAVAGAQSRAPVAAIPVIALGLLPLVAAVVAAAVMLGRWAAGRLLRAGGEPQAVSISIATLAACGAVILVGLALGDPRRGMPAWTATVPVVAVALAVLTFHLSRRGLVRMLGVDPVLDGGVLPRPRRRPPLRGWVVLAGALALATAGAVVLGVLAGSRGTSVSAPAPPLSLPPPHGRVAVLAVDGLAREDLDALPRLFPQDGWASVREWAWAEVAGLQDTLPAVRWTTVACGAPAARHGVEVMEEVRLFGQPSGIDLAPPVRLAMLALWRPLGAAVVVAHPTLDRRLPTFWEMASRAGCPVTVGGWWGSWPVRRVLGDVASERAWLGGAWGRDAATPSLASLVREAWSEAGSAADASDILARRLADMAAASSGTHLVALALPSIDLQERAEHSLPPLASAQALRPHLQALGAVIDTLRRGGFTLWLVGMPWRGGTAFVATSDDDGGRFGPVSDVALASTWLAQLGLPPGLGAPDPRADLLGMRVETMTEVDYGPPPPPLGLPTAASAAVQREVLRNLGYLR